MSDETNGWIEWRKYVLEELKRLNGCYEEQHRLFQESQVEIAVLKIKSGIWGLVAGLIPATGLLIYYIVKKG